MSIKKFLLSIFILLSLFSFVIGNSYANTDNIYVFNVSMHDKNLEKFIIKSREVFEYKQKQNLLKTAIKSIDRTFITKDKADDISALCYELAENAKFYGDYDAALKWYWAGANVYKNPGTYENNHMVLGHLFNGFDITNKAEQNDNTKDLKKMFLLEIEQSQLGLADKYPNIFKDIFESLADYYSNLNDEQKVFQYQQKADKAYAKYLKKNPVELEAEGIKVYISNPKVAKYIDAVYNTDNYTEKQKNLMLAVNTIDKNNINTQNALTVAIINCWIGQNAKEYADINMAAEAFLRSYKMLKAKNIHKNNRIALYCLGNIYYFSQLSKDEKFTISILEELVETQSEYEKIYSKVFSEYYKNLAEYYKNDSSKYDYYLRKANALEK